MEYTFNEHRVCENPTVFLSKETKEYEVELSVAQAENGKWDYGYRLHIKFGCMTYKGGLPSNYKATFDSAEAAKKEALEWLTPALKNALTEARQWNANANHYNKTPKTEQLELF